MGTKRRRKKLTRKEKERQVDRMPKDLIAELNTMVMPRWGQCFREWYTWIV